MKKKKPSVVSFPVLTSRTERRQFRRLYKLQLHENDRNYNRLRSFSI